MAMLNSQMVKLELLYLFLPWKLGLYRVYPLKSHPTWKPPTTRCFHPQIMSDLVKLKKRGWMGKKFEVLQHSGGLSMPVGVSRGIPVPIDIPNRLDR